MLPRPGPHGVARVLARGSIALGIVATLLVLVPVAAAATPSGEETIPLPDSITGGGATTSVTTSTGGTGAIARMIVGLAIVLAVVYGLYWLLKRVYGNKGGAIRAEGGLEVLASLPLGPNRGLHLVEVGDELVLVGTGENGVSPVRSWTSDESRKLRAALEQPTLPPRAGGGGGLVDELRRRTLRS